MLEKSRKKTIENKQKKNHKKFVDKLKIVHGFSLFYIRLIL